MRVARRASQDALRVSSVARCTTRFARPISHFACRGARDARRPGARAGRSLIRTLNGEVKPVMAWHSLPVLTHMNRHAPSMQPMKDMYTKAIAAERSGEVLNASILGGWPLADIPHVGVHGVIVANRPQANEAQALLMDLMTMTWDRRDDFFFAVEPVENSISRAKGMNEGPIVLADHGDVAGSGGSTLSLIHI